MVYYRMISTQALCVCTKRYIDSILQSSSIKKVVTNGSGETQ